MLRHIYFKKIIKLLSILSLCMNIASAEEDNNQNTINLRIINGTEVLDSDDTWRFIVALKYDNSQYCGGSLIASKWILTAAHCLCDAQGNPYEALPGDTVGLGSYDLFQTTDYSIKRFIVHPSYDAVSADKWIL